MQRQSYQVKTVLEQKGARKKIFLAFKDSLGYPLSRSPIILKQLMSLKESSQNNPISGPNPEGMPCTTAI